MVCDSGVRSRVLRNGGTAVRQGESTYIRSGGMRKGRCAVEHGVNGGAMMHDAEHSSAGKVQNIVWCDVE